MGLDGMTGGISVNYGTAFVLSCSVYNGRGAMDKIGSK